MSLVFTRNTLILTFPVKYTDKNKFVLKIFSLYNQSVNN